MELGGGVDSSAQDPGASLGLCSAKEGQAPTLVAWPPVVGLLRCVSHGRSPPTEAVKVPLSRSPLQVGRMGCEW